MSIKEVDVGDNKANVRLQEGKSNKQCRTMSKSGEDGEKKMEEGKGPGIYVGTS